MRTVRCTLGQIAEQGSLDASGQLKVDDSVVAVAYFRAGYSPNDYPTDVEWKARCEPTTPLHDSQSKIRASPFDPTWQASMELAEQIEILEVVPTVS